MCGQMTTTDGAFMCFPNEVKLICSVCCPNPFLQVLQIANSFISPSHNSKRAPRPKVRAPGQQALVDACGDELGDCGAAEACMGCH